MAGDQSLLKRINQMAIVRCVKERPGTFRRELASTTGLAGSTISVLVNGLIEDGWLRAHPTSEGRGAGRRPSALSLDPGRLALVGAELGVDYLSVAACNLLGETLFSRLGDYEHHGAERSVRDAAAQLAEALAFLRGSGRRALGVGVGLPGMVSPEGLLRFAPHIGWRDLAVGPMLAEALRRARCGDLPISVLNDANAGALGEYVFGLGPPADSLVYLSVSYGVGAGIVLDDRLQLGHAGLSGEVGHSILRPDGDPCPCGRRGCAETLLSQRALSRAATGRDEPILHVSELLRLLEQGVPAAVAGARAVGEHLGLLLHNLVVTIDPAVVVLGGPLSGLPELVDAARARLAQLSGSAPVHRSEVRPSRYGTIAGAVGAAASVLHDRLRPLPRRPGRVRG